VSPATASALCFMKARRGAKEGVMPFSPGTSPFYYFSALMAPKEPGCVRAPSGAAGNVYSDQAAQRHSGSKWLEIYPVSLFGGGAHLTFFIENIFKSNNDTFN